MSEIIDLEFILAASFNTDLIQLKIKPLVEQWISNIQIKLTPYHQIFQQLLNPNSMFSTNSTGVNIILFRFSDFQYQKKMHTEELLILIEDINKALVSFLSRAHVPLVVCFCPDDNIYNWAEEKIIEKCHKLAESYKLYFIKSNSVVKRNFTDACYDRISDKIAHIPYTEAGFFIISFIILTKSVDILKKFSKRINSVDKEILNFDQNNINESLILFKNFLDKLEIKLNYKDIEESLISKIFQLTHLVRGFNFTEEILQPDEIKNLLSSGHKFILLEVSDRFGNYGLSGLVLYTFSTKALVVKNILLNCRILGKSIEYLLLKQLAGLAKDNNVDTIIIHFKKTSRNNLAYAFLNSFKCESITLNEFSFNITNLINLDNFHIYTTSDSFSSKHIKHMSLSQVRYLQLLSQASKKLKNVNLKTYLLEYFQVNVEQHREQAQNNGSYFFIEEILSKIWSDALNIHNLNRKNNFFELGGNSLLIVSILSKISKLFSVQLSLGDFYQNPTVKDLSKIIFAKKKYNIIDSSNNFEYEATYPLFSSQKRIWFLEQLYPGNFAYNISISYILEGLLNIQALQYAFNKLLEEHDVFKTSFHTINGEVYQIVHANAVINIEVFDLKDFDENQIQALVVQEGRLSFVLEKHPLLRVKIYCLADKKYILIITTHHIIYDGWSYKILNKAIQDYYRDYLFKIQRLPDYQPFAYLNYMLGQKKLYDCNAWDYQYNFWSHYLKDMPLLNLTADYPESSEQIFSGVYVSLSVASIYYSKLKELAKNAHISLFAILFSLWSLTIYAFTGCKDFPLGTISTGREECDVENIIGYFAKTLMVRIKISNKTTFIEYAKEIYNNLLLVFSNQDIPYNDIIKKFVKRPSAIYTDPLEVLMVFLMHNAHDITLQLNGMASQVYRKHDDIAKYKLTLELEEIDNSLQGGIYYCDKIFKLESIQKVMAIFYCLIKKITITPNISIDNLKLKNISMNNTNYQN